MNNPVSTWLKGLGWLIIIGGVALAFYFGREDVFVPGGSFDSELLEGLTKSAGVETRFDLQTFAVYSFSSLVAGLFFIGLSEIIKLLQSIKDRSERA
ncbi:hypothetical protein [Paenibacillus xanthanilyticus]|uniref:DUF4321 domain-containing protein n=1 Tax=Paenibacillus xanthanilyticus TaxID=1783531 RepID=A0ABV8KC47_9BACL